MKLKWLVTGVFAVLVAVVVAAYVVLATMDFDDLRPTIEAKANEATGRELRIAGPIDLMVSLTPAITIEGVTVANADWGSQPEMLSVGRIEVQVKLLPILSGDIQITRLVLVEPVIRLETDTDGQGNWVFASAAQAPASEGTAQAPAALPAFHQVDVRDARVVYRDGATGQEFRVDLTALHAEASSPASPIAFTLAGRYNGEAFDASGTIGSRDQLLTGAAFPFDVTAAAGGATIEAEGAIAEPLAGQGIDLRFRARGDSLADLAPLAGADLPPLGPYAVGAQVRPEGNSIKLTGLTLEMGGSDLAGSLTASLDGARPAVSGTLTAGTLDLADFTPSGQAPSEPAAEEQEEERRFVFTETSIPLDGLTAFDARIKVTVGRLHLNRQVALDNVDVTVAISGGHLTVEPFSVGLSGGTLSGAVVLDARSPVPHLDLKVTATQVDYGRLLRTLEVTDSVSGALDADLRLRASGASPRALASTLDGRIEVVGGAGSIRNDWLQASATGVIDMLSYWREEDSDLRLNCVVARLPVETGVMTTEAILIDTDAVTVGGTGTVDLREEALDLKVTPQAKETGLLSLAVPFLIGGTLAEPSVVPDPVGTAVGAAKIAGMFINPLVAGAAILLDSNSADENACVAALQQPAPEPSGAAPAQEDTSVVEDAVEEVTDQLEGVTDSVEDVGEGITRGLKSLFDN